MVFFNPNSPKYQRGVIIIQWGLMAVAGVGVLLTNWGTREHVFTGIQQFAIPKIDRLFQLTPEEIERSKRKYLESVNNDEEIITQGLKSQVLKNKNVEDESMAYIKY